jgi:uncharacterized protein YpuA (DUF1002 family)
MNDKLELIYSTIKDLKDFMDNQGLKLTDEQLDDIDNLLFDLKMIKVDYKK